MEPARQPGRRRDPRAATIPRKAIPPPLHVSVPPAFAAWALPRPPPSGQTIASPGVPSASVPTSASVSTIEGQSLLPFGPGGSRVPTEDEAGGPSSSSTDTAVGAPSATGPSGTKPRRAAASVRAAAVPALRRGGENIERARARRGAARHSPGYRPRSGEMALAGGGAAMAGPERPPRPRHRRRAAAACSAGLRPLPDRRRRGYRPLPDRRRRARSRPPRRLAGFGCRTGAAAARVVRGLIRRLRLASSRFGARRRCGCPEAAASRRRQAGWRPAARAASRPGRPPGRRPRRPTRPSGQSGSRRWATPLRRPATVPSIDASPTSVLSAGAPTGRGPDARRAAWADIPSRRSRHATSPPARRHSAR